MNRTYCSMIDSYMPPGGQRSGSTASASYSFQLSYGYKVLATATENNKPGDERERDGACGILERLGIWILRILQ